MLNTHLRDQLLSLRNNNDKAVRLLRGSIQTITDTTTTAVIFESSEWNQGGMWSSASNPERITPTTTARFMIGGSVRWQGSTAGSFRAAYLSRDADLTWEPLVLLAHAGGISTSPAHSFYLEFASSSTSNYFGLAVRHDRGSNLDVLTAVCSVRMLGSSA